MLDTEPGRSDAPFCCRNEDGRSSNDFTQKHHAAVVVQGILHALVSRASFTGRGESADLARIRELSGQCLHATRM